MKVEHLTTSSDRLGPVAFFPAAHLNDMHVECVFVYGFIYDCIVNA